MRWSVVSGLRDLTAPEDSAGLALGFGVEVAKRIGQAGGRVFHGFLYIPASASGIVVSVFFTLRFDGILFLTQKCTT